jgi:hypothetical protein
MLRINLSSRPFYNERLVSAVIAVVGVVAVAVAVVGVQQMLSLSSTRTQLRDQIARDQMAGSRADIETVALQKAINTVSLKNLAVSTQLANTLIDERTFSWTVFFGLIEKTLPYDVRVESVAPIVDKQGILVQMRVVSKSTDDLATFIDGLLKTGAFYDVLPRQEDATDDGMRRTSVEARYLPPATPGGEAPTKPEGEASTKPATPAGAAPTTPAKPGGEASTTPAAPAVKKGGGL